MNRRDFMSKGAIGLGVISSGCIDVGVNSNITIVEPTNGAEVGKVLDIDVEVSNYTIQDPTISTTVEDSGYVVITVDEELDEGFELEDAVNVDEWLNGQTEDKITLRVPGDHTVRSYVANSERKVTSDFDSVEITSSFEVPSSIIIGQGQSLNVEPNYVAVPVGTELTFNWGVNGVNLVSTQSPEGVSWSGVNSLQPSGFSYSYRFDTPGIYKYQCEPHSDVMRGTIRVV